MPPVPQIRRIGFNDEEIGMGFDSRAGLAIGTALESFTIGENPAAPGAEVTASVSIVSSHEELQESLGMSFEAQGRYGFYSGSAKAKFSESTRFNSTSTFLVARCIVENPLRRGKNFQVSAAARALLDSNRLDEFRTAFGDSFVRGLQTGGEFYAVIRITSMSTTTQSELAVTLQAGMQGLVAAAEFKAAFEKAQSSASTRSEFTATMYQKAGSGAQIAPTVSIEDVIARFKEFPEIARTSAAAYETEVATYDTLPLPLPTPEEQENFLLALADARERKLRWIQLRNDLQFALQNPQFFEGLPPVEQLNAAIGTYTRLINGVMAHAVRLSRGQITPPQLFDPATLAPPATEPAAIPLRRATVVTETVQIPHWTKIEHVRVPLPGTSPQTLPNARQLGLLAHVFQHHDLPDVVEPGAPDGIDPDFGRILSITPSPGTSVPKGSTVVVHYIGLGGGGFAPLGTVSDTVEG